MPLEPKGGKQPPAERPFVDREDFIAPVHSALKEPKRTKPLVLVYHGGAGIGKSRLRRELVRQMAADPGVVTAVLDFDIPIYHQPETALFSLRNSIGETYKVRFPSFDLAYAVLWQKTHPDMELRAVGSSQETVDRAEPGGTEGIEGQRNQETSGWLEPDSLVSRLLDESGKLPLIGLVPRIAKLLTPVDGDSPDSGLPTTDYYATWWRQRGERELEDLPQTEPGEIVGHLPALWAADLKDHLAGDETLLENRGQSPGAAASDVPGAPQERALRDSPRFRGHVPQRRAVLFIDAYEKLGGTEGSRQETVDSRQKQDEWVRELVKQLPEVLWIVCGRQKLRWEEVDKDWSESLSQHQLGSLPDQASRMFLSSCGITNEPIQDAIVKGSQGVPHYLDLAVDTVERTKDEGQGAKLTGDSPDELVKQFVRHLDQPEIDALQVLSAPRFWYYGLFENLMAEYQTGYPASAYDDLARFSFVKEGAAPGTRTMHDLMREALQQAQSPELRKRVHLFLHELYAGHLKGLGVKGITEKHRTALTEAFYHGRQAMSAQQLWAWFDPAAQVFREAWQFRVLLPLCREMTRALEVELGPNHADVATALWRLAGRLYSSAEFREAEPVLRRALAIAETGKGPEHPHHLEFVVLLGDVLNRLGRFDEAEAMSRPAVEALDREPGRDARMLVEAMGDLVSALSSQCKYAEAEALSRRALAISENELGPDHEITVEALRRLTALLFKQARFAEAEPIERHVLAMYERKWGANHPLTLTSLNNVGTLLSGLGRYPEAERLHRRVLKLSEETLGPDHEHTAIARNNLACIFFNVGRYAEAEPLCRQSLATRERKFGPDHPSTTQGIFSLIATLVSLDKYAEAEQMALSLVADCEKKRGPDHVETAYALEAAGRAYSSQARYAEASSYLGRALEVYTKALGPEHPRTLISLGWLARTEAKQGSYAEAERLCRDLFAKEERTFGPEHPEVALTAYRLAGICSRDGRYEEAETLLRRALAIREKVFGPDHAFVAEVLEGLTKVCDQTGRAAEAQQLTARAKSIRDKAEVASQKTADSSQ